MQNFKTSISMKGRYTIVVEFRYALLLVVMSVLYTSCSVGDFKQQDDTVIETQRQSTGKSITIALRRGDHWFHIQRIAVFNVPITPQCAIWVEDTAGNHLQTLYVTQRFARQEWQMAKYDDTSCIRTMCLPYWFNKYLKSGHPVPTKAQPLPDAVTAATPTGSFTLHSRLNQDTGRVVLLVELNKSFDYNTTFTKHRKKSKFNGQPPVVYAGTVDLSRSRDEIELQIIGRSGETGDDAKLYHDVQTLTSSLQMVKRVTVVLKK